MTQPDIDRPDHGRRYRLRGLRPRHHRFPDHALRAPHESRRHARPRKSCLPRLPLQVVCYERADDIAFGVSGVVTRARGIRASLPHLDDAAIPMAAPVTQEKVVYLLDPAGASRRSPMLRLADRLVRALGLTRNHGVELPYTPAFLHKHGGLVMSLGQFMQFVGSELMASGTVQIWPGMPVDHAINRG